MCNLVYHDFVGYALSPRAIKACHPLPTSKDSGNTIPTILKFFYFSEIIETFGRRRTLSGQKGIQAKTLFISERLPKLDREIKRRCDDMNLITTTKKLPIESFFFANDIMVHFIPEVKIVLLQCNN